MTIRTSMSRTIVSRMWMKESNEACPKGTRSGMFHTPSRTILLLLLASIPDGAFMSDLALTFLLKIIPMGTIVTTVGIASTFIPRMVLLRNETKTSRMSRRPATMSIRARISMNTITKTHPSLSFSRTSV